MLYQVTTAAMWGGKAPRLGEAKNSNFSGKEMGKAPTEIVAVGMGKWGQAGVI